MSQWKQIRSSQAVLAREAGAIHRDHGGKLTVALAYPNSYAVGMSSLALQILYRQFNERPDIVCERVFWDAVGAASGQSLRTLESQTPVAQFAVWAFTISFELDYFNVVAMLRQAGVAPLAADRAGAGSGPLLIAGGPGITMNPEPIALFFDAIVIGEAEELVPSLLQVLSDGLIGQGTLERADRERLLDRLEALPGVYVPSRLEPSHGGRQIQRLWVSDMARLQPFSALYTPDTEFPNRHLIEIARGCGRGCRFCLAGYVYRPPREQPMTRILEWARDGMQRRTAEGLPLAGIGLVSAAVSDHPAIDQLAQALSEMGVRISVSSMRTDPISVPLMEALAASGTQTLTIAPEAGTERLRRVINKGQSEEGLLSAVEMAQKLGFPQLKLYFMIGHPSETEEDIDGIVELSLKARRLYRRNITINATPFVPKAHTPFQWAAMQPARETTARQRRLSKALFPHQVTVHADPADWAEIQGILARADRKLAPVLMATERLTPRAFRAAMARFDLNPEDYLSERQPGQDQPWDVVAAGVKPSFLRYERRLAAAERLGHCCPPGAQQCLTCGACGDTLAMAVAEGSAGPESLA